MSDASKVGVAGGSVVLGLGAILARCGDDVVRSGAHGARFVDDAAVVGASPRVAAWGPNGGARITADDAARVGLGADDAVRLGVRVERAGVPGMRGVALGDDAMAAGAGEGPWFEAMRDFGIDVGIEVVSTDFGDELPQVVATAGQVRCPRRVEVTRTPDAWEELLGGLGVACAPVVVVGTASASGNALRVGTEDVPLVDMARACADVGARCVLVGCPAAQAEACVAGSEESFVDNPLRPSLREYVRGFVAQAFSQAVPPVVIAELAVVGGAAKLVIARSDASEE